MAIKTIFVPPCFSKNDHGWKFFLINFDFRTKLIFGWYRNNPSKVAEWKVQTCQKKNTTSTIIPSLSSKVGTNIILMARIAGGCANNTKFSGHTYQIKRKKVLFFFWISVAFHAFCFYSGIKAVRKLELV